MRALTAFIILASCQCFLANEQINTPRQIKDTLNTILGKQSKPVKQLVSCAKSLGLQKCINALAVWRAEQGVEAFSKDPSTSFNLTQDVLKFPWKNYANVSSEYLEEQLLDCTQKLLLYRPLTFNMITGYSAKLKAKGNSSVCIDIHKTDVAEGRGTMKKLQKEFYKLAPILMVPGLIISAILPFALPSLKMMVMMVGMLNNMALTGAIFTILRNNAFNDKYNHRIVYVNNGYKNDKIQFDASKNEEHFHTNHLGIIYEHPKNIAPGKELQFDESFDNIEELPPSAVSPQWINEYTDNKMLAMLRKEPNENIYYNGNLPISRSKL